MMKYEYMVFYNVQPTQISEVHKWCEAITKELNSFGAEGWEVIQVQAVGIYHLKRRLREHVKEAA